jgi:hypothetical protein
VTRPGRHGPALPCPRSTSSTLLYYDISHGTVQYCMYCTVLRSAVLYSTTTIVQKTVLISCRPLNSISNRIGPPQRLHYIRVIDSIRWTPHPPHFCILWGDSSPWQGMVLGMACGVWDFQNAGKKLINRTSNSIWVLPSNSLQFYNFTVLTVPGTVQYRVVLP